MAAHPLHQLGFEPLVLKQRGSSMARLGFEPVTHVKSLGMIEASSGRKIVQPTDSPAVNQALATAAMGDYKARLSAAIKHIPGATLASSRDAKNPLRLEQKIIGEGQPAATVTDYGAAQIAVDSVQAKDAVVAAVRQDFPVLREQDYFVAGDPKYHYRRYSLQLQMPNGTSEELQIVPRPVQQTNRAEHHKYAQARNAEIAGENAEPARAAAQALNDTAMQKFAAAGARIVKGTVQKGSRVRLADGAVARVLYVDPNMRIARVRTEDGRNITVRHRDLRGSAER